MNKIEQDEFENDQEPDQYEDHPHDDANGFGHRSEDLIPDDELEEDDPEEFEED